MAVTTSKTKKKKPDLSMTRIIDAPRETVFDAWTNHERVAKWWGPEGFDNPVCEMDPHPGGAIRIDMRGPDGVVYPMKGVFHEVVAPERLVFLSSAFEGNDGSPHLEALNTVTFSEQNQKTKLKLDVVVMKATPEIGPALEGMPTGWSQSLDKLAEYLEGG